jgi:NDP-sugar pyrophosphorylase family protein
MSKEIVNIVIPMAGKGTRFSAAGYKDPKPLIDVFGKTMIQAVIENLLPLQPHRFIFVSQKEHYIKYDLEKLFNESLGNNWECVTLDSDTEGAACSVLAAEHLFDNEQNLVIANADQIVDVAQSDFIQYGRGVQSDGLVMTFPATGNKWSYIRLNEHGLGVQVAEKKAISTHATTGIYFYRTGRSFISAAKQMIKKNNRINNEFYVAPVYNEIIGSGGQVRIWPIESREMHGIGTPEDLEAYFDAKGGYNSKSLPNKEWQTIS